MIIIVIKKFSLYFVITVTTFTIYGKDDFTVSLDDLYVVSTFTLYLQSCLTAAHYDYVGKEPCKEQTKYFKLPHGRNF